MGINLEHDKTQYFTELIFSDLYIIYIFIKKKKESENGFVK